LKLVSGILLDVFAARDIFTRAIPAEVAAIGNLRANNRLAFCMDEEDAFRSDPHAIQAFGNQDPSFCKCTDQFYDYCETLAAQIPDHRFLGESRSQLHVAAFARSHNLGVLSEHKSNFYATVHECCQMIGVYYWNATTYFPDEHNIQFI
jgi:hypothetical protein